MSLPISPEELRHEYVTCGRSDKDIAEDYLTYPNAVRRLRLRYGIPSRDKSEAQKLALEHGRHEHPTKGKPRDEATRQQISETVAQRWEKKSPEERLKHVERARAQWNGLSEAQKEQMRTLAAEAIREAAVTGSKLERFLHQELLSRGYRVELHKDDLLLNEKLHLDLFLPEKRVAIEVDGIAHFEPIWGEDYLQKKRASDLQKNGLVLGLGLLFIRIKQTGRSLTEKKKRESLTRLLEVLEEGGDSRLLEIVI